MEPVRREEVSSPGVLGVVCPPPNLQGSIDWRLVFLLAFLAMLIANAVSPAGSARADVAREQQAKSELRVFGEIWRQQVRSGARPASFASLLVAIPDLADDWRQTGRGVDGYGEPHDPWGNAYWCETHRVGRVRLGSAGPDGAEGGGDDIVLDLSVP